MLSYRDINVQDQSLFEDRISRVGTGIQAETKEITNSLQKLVSALQQYQLSQQQIYSIANRYGHRHDLTHLNMTLLAGAIYYTIRTNLKDPTQLDQLEETYFIDIIQIIMSTFKRGTFDARSTEEQDLESRILQNSIGASLVRYIRYYLQYLKI